MLENLWALLTCKHVELTYHHLTFRGDGKFLYTTYICNYCHRPIKSKSRP